MASPVRLMVVDDQASFLRAASRSLGSDPDITVVHAVDSAAAALAALHDEPDVDVALIDLSMPEVNGVDAIALLHRDHPSIRPVLMSTYEPEDLPQAAKELAVSYLRKADLTPDRVLALARLASDASD